jgi:hypothetical protein
MTIAFAGGSTIRKPIAGAIRAIQQKTKLRQATSVRATETLLRFNFDYSFCLRRANGARGLPCPRDGAFPD